jgi:hypothetical protein
MYGFLLIGTNFYGTFVYFLVTFTAFTSGHFAFI